MHALCPPEFRDLVRIALGRPIGSTSGEPGTMPSPTNAEITLTANAQLGDLDAHAHLMPILSYRLLLHAQASTMTGPMQIPIDNDEWQPGLGRVPSMSMKRPSWWLMSRAGSADLPKRISWPLDDYYNICICERVKYMKVNNICSRP